MKSPVRGVFFASVCFSLGIILQHSGPDRNIRLVVTLAILLSVFLSRKLNKSLRDFFVLLLFISIGWTVSAPMKTASLPNESVRISGTIYGPVRDFEKRQYRIRMDKWQSGLRVDVLNGNAVFYVDKGSGLIPGEKIEIIGKIEKIPGRRNPCGFDPSAYWGSRGINYRIYQVKQVTRLQPSSAVNLSYLIYKIQQFIEKRIEEDGSISTNSYAKALLTGNRSGWDEPDRIQLANSGILHLFAISGLHIGMVTLILNMLFLGFSPKLRYILTLVCLWIFVPITSANPPVVRAAIMVSFYLVGKLINRKADPVFHMCLVYMFLLFLHPASLFEPGFQLTFAGTFGSLYAARTFNSMLLVGSFKKYSPSVRIVSKYGMRVLYALVISLFAFITTAPIVIYHFGRFPWMGPVVSLIALPIIVLILVSGWLMVFSAFWTGLSSVFAASLHGWISILLGLTRQSNETLPFNDWLPQTAFIPALVVVVLLYAMVKRLKRAPLASVLIMSLLILNLTVYPGLMIADQGIHFTVFDVGQGDGFLINRGKRTVLIDGGRGENSEVPDQLRIRGLDRIDMYFLTHGDEDHTGVAKEILEKVDVGLLVVGPEIWRDNSGREILQTAIVNNIPVAIGKTGLAADLGKLGTIKVLHPYREYDPNLADNDLSLVFYWQSGNSQVLFPGDISSAVENELVKRLERKDIDIVVAGHHGSRHSTSNGWLDFWNPELAVISCGRNNPYGHPSRDVLDRLTEKDIIPMRTDQSGCFTFTMKSEKLVMIPWNHRKF